MWWKKRKTEEKDVGLKKPKYKPITFSERDGVRYFHFGTKWIQGAMRIDRPEWIELEYAQQMMAWMLFMQTPKRIAQLGLGAGALTKFCYANFPKTEIDVVEFNDSVITMCHSMFNLPQPDERLHILNMDAMDFVKNSANSERFDVMQVDLYDADAQGPVLDTPEFYKACSDCLAQSGIMVVNLFGNHPSYAKNMDAISPAFDTLWSLPRLNVGNVVALAFKEQPTKDFDALFSRASDIAKQTGMPAKKWVNGLKITQTD